MKLESFKLKAAGILEEPVNLEWSLGFRALSKVRAAFENAIESLLNFRAVVDLERLYAFRIALSNLSGPSYLERLSNLQQDFKYLSTLL